MNEIKIKTIKQVIDSINLMYEANEIAVIDIVYLTKDGVPLRDLGTLTRDESKTLTDDQIKKISEFAISILKNEQK